MLDHENDVQRAIAQYSMASQWLVDASHAAACMQLAQSIDRRAEMRLDMWPSPQIPIDVHLLSISNPVISTASLKLMLHSLVFPTNAFH